MKDQILFNCHSDRLQRKTLRYYLDLEYLVAGVRVIKFPNKQAVLIKEKYFIAYKNLVNIAITTININPIKKKQTSIKSVLRVETLGHTRTLKVRADTWTLL